jgi:protein-S-isoprenylcysteine O-methyltransferase Ste14
MPATTPTPGFLARGGGWVLAQSVLLLLLLGAGPVGGSPPGAWAWLSAPGFLIGAWLGIAGAKHLGSARTAYPHPLPTAPLITDGIYRRVRHPLYAALIWLGIAWSILWSSWLSAGVVVGLAGLLWAKARREERWLGERQPEYAEYARRVPGFWPWPRGDRSLDP